MNNIAVSVIVAIYNAEKTLLRLLDSLLAQTIREFEVLLVDDGSTDSSGAICDSYAGNDGRFRVFHKRNEGIGATRQFGIEHAVGEYTIHADADDWVEPDYLEALYRKAVESGADMVMCDFFEEKWRKSVYNRQAPSSYSKDGLLDDFLCRLAGVPWNKLIRRRFYAEHNIKYVEGLNYGEDKIFNIELVTAGASVSYLPSALYHADQLTNQNSAVRGVSAKHLMEREKYVSILRQMLPQRQYQSGIDSAHIGSVFIAVCSNIYPQTVFFEKYAFLRRVKWKDYGSRAFSTKLVIWTALHCSYRLGSFLSKIKKAVIRLKM